MGNANATCWAVCRSLLGCCAAAVCRSGFACCGVFVLLFSGAFVGVCVCVCSCVFVGCVAAWLVAAVQLFGVPFVSPSSLVLVLGTWAVGFTLGFPWCMSRHVMFFMLTLPLFSRARCVCVWVVCKVRLKFSF